MLRHNLHIKDFLIKLMLRIWRKIIKCSFGLFEKVERFLLDMLILKRSEKNINKDTQGRYDILQPMELFFNQKRFDIVFKYFYAKWASITKSDFPKQVYLSHIFAFNNFYEDEPHKKQPVDFLDSFNELLGSVRKDGFNRDYPVSVHPNGELENGVHRFVSAMVTNNEIPTIISNTNGKTYYDYRFFNERGIPDDFSDLNACLYVPMNHFARIFFLFPAAEPQYDYLVRNILNKYGFIYYEKELRLTYNGYINLKKIIYSKDKNNPCDETSANSYNYLKMYALNSIADGKSPLRVLVWVCKYDNDYITVVREIKSIYSIINYNSYFYLSNTHEEAIELSQIMFNENSLYCLDNRPHELNTYEFDNYIEIVKQDLILQKVPLETVCACENSPMFVFGISKFNKISFLCIDKFKDSIVNNFDVDDFLLVHKDEIILNPKYHFFYHGIKIITLDVLFQFINNRNEQPNDVNDCYLIRKFKDRSWSMMSMKRFDEKPESGNA